MMSHIDWLHIILVGLAILGPVFVKMVKDKGHDQIAAVLDAVIRGVEDHYETSGDRRVKEAIRDRAEVEGVQDALHPIVKRVTPE